MRVSWRDGATEFLLSIPAHIGIHCYTLAGGTCEETIRQTGESLHAELGRLWVEVEAPRLVGSREQAPMRTNCSIQG